MHDVVIIGEALRLVRSTRTRSRSQARAAVRFGAAAGLRRPRNPVRGLEIAGVVVETGAKVTAFAPGDEVFETGQGSFSEYAPASQSTLVRKPSNVGFEEAAAVPVSATTALVGVRRED
jgi:NADPH:quinone reductase-like Zn-dependent oxidoreductase